MTQAATVSLVAHQIQLAVAPVFLIAGIGALLNVMALRLTRVIERSRSIEREFADMDEETRRLATADLRVLDRRMTMVNLAITSCTAAALLVCIVIATLFVADLTDFAFGPPIAWLFISAMLLMVVGLSFFLWEIRLAMRAHRVQRERMPHRRKKPDS